MNTPAANASASSARSWLARLAAPLVVLALLAGAAQSVQSRKPAEATEYFDRVRRAAGDLPRVIGDWYGKDVPVAAPAIKTLKPNFTISRRYQNLRTGRIVQLTLIQSRDAYDMVYHYPPNCYRHNGWTRLSSDQRFWHAGDLPISLMEYRFHRSKVTSEEEVIVGNFVILSTGFALDMKAIEAVAKDPEQRPYGAAQVQFLFDATVSEAERKAVFDQIMAHLQPLLLEMVKRHPDARESLERAALQ